MTTRPHVTKAQYLVLNGWRQTAEGGWMDPTKGWPDELTDTEAYKIQKARELEKKSAHETRHGRA